MTDHVISTPRLLLPVATPASLKAMAGGDADRFLACTGFGVDLPLVPPPETGDVIDYFHDAIVANPAIQPWFFRWIIDRRSADLIGSAGFGGMPDEDGVLLIGYSVYPRFEGQGFASEAARGLVQWAFSEGGATTVRATIFPANIGSQRVAEKAGLRFCSTMESEEDGTVEVWEITRPAGE